MLGTKSSKTGKPFIIDLIPDLTIPTISPREGLEKIMENWTYHFKPHFMQLLEDSISFKKLKSREDLLPLLAHEKIIPGYGIFLKETVSLTPGKLSFEKISWHHCLISPSCNKCFLDFISSKFRR